MTSYVQYVNSNGYVDYNHCDWSDKGVRPFSGRRRKKVRETLKLESCHEKNRQPFHPKKWKDKYKGTKYYDRR
jgi:hypothetical protein